MKKTPKKHLLKLLHSEKNVQVEFVRLASISRPQLLSEVSDGQDSLPDWSQAASRGTSEDVISGVKAASCRALPSAAAV